MGCKQSHHSSDIDELNQSQHTLNVQRAYIDLSQHEIQDERRVSNANKYENQLAKLRKDDLSQNNLDLSQHNLDLSQHNLDLSQHEMTETDIITLTEPVEIVQNNIVTTNDIVLSESPTGVDELSSIDNYQGKDVKKTIAIKQIVIDSKNDDLDNSIHSTFTECSNHDVSSKYYEDNNQTDNEKIILNDNDGATHVSFYGSSAKGISGSNNASKPNQDAYVIEHCLKTESLILICMDGHGSKGHFASQFCKFFLKTHLKSHPEFATDLKKAITEVLHSLDIALKNDQLVETIFSGTTLVLAVIRDKVITVANIGDSKAILGYRKKLTNDSKDNTYGFIVQPLSVVHKPDSPDERARIISTGGRVMIAVDYQGIPWGPARVYLRKEDIPGLAMSRSLGDDAVHAVGVSSEPSFETIDIKEFRNDGIKVGEGNDAPRFALFVATDGLFDVISNVDIIKTAFECEYNPKETVESLKKKAQSLWLKTFGLVDDTTIVCAVL